MRVGNVKLLGLLLLTNGASPPNLDSTKSCKRSGASRDIGGYLADHHYRRRIRRDELRGHDEVFFFSSQCLGYYST